MNRNIKLLIAAVVVIIIVIAAWYGWRRYKNKSGFHGSVAKRLNHSGRWYGHDGHNSHLGDDMTYDYNAGQEMFANDRRTSAAQGGVADRQGHSGRWHGHDGHNFHLGDDMTYDYDAGLQEMYSNCGM